MLDAIKTSRPVLRAEAILLLVLAWIVVVMNGSWWQAVLAGRSLAQPSSWLFAVATAIALLALHFVLLAPLVNRWTLRPLLSVVVIASAVAAYFMRAYSVMLDPTMLQNVLKTDARETSELITWSMVAWVAAVSVLPVVLLWWVRVEQRPFMRALVGRVGFMLGALVVAVLAILSVNRDLTPMMRNHRELRYLITPGNFIFGLAAQSVKSVEVASGPRIPVGRDARASGVQVPGRKPDVFVLVVGETARAANFSLLGYDRQTTPELASLPVTAFSDVHSCGTSTEVSLPCMFSPYGRADYDEKKIRSSEGLLNVLAHAGLAVTWIDNQSGCKGVCDGKGIRVIKPEPAAHPDLCRDMECWDGVLVPELESELTRVQADTVIVLHMMGNHGPAYHLRYPPEFRHFTPECATAQLRDCTREQVVNSYDDAIRYTDHVLASLIHVLERHADSVSPALLYLSDHGESLGELGLYLHGMPYAIAPDTQKHVPLITWIPPAFAAARQLDMQCLAQSAARPLTHDNLFDSVLGVLDIATAAYRPERDFFRGCRRDRT